MSNAHGLVDWLPASHADEPGSTPSGSKNFFNKTTWMRVFSQINNCQQKTKQKNKTKNKSKKQTKQKGGLRF